MGWNNIFLNEKNKLLSQRQSPLLCPRFSNVFGHSKRLSRAGLLLDCCWLGLQCVIRWIEWKGIFWPTFSQSHKGHKKGKANVKASFQLALGTARCLWLLTRTASHMFSLWFQIPISSRKDERAYCRALVLW